VKYVVTLDGEPTTVELLERDGRTFVVSDGRETPAELARVRNGAWSLLLGGRSLVIVAAAGYGEVSLTVGAETWRASVLDEREAQAAEAAGGRAARRGGGVQRAVMPGIVREVLVAAGAQVERGAPLLILEAMKMQNEVRADAPGRVAQVHVAAGTAVAKGDPLVTLA
jgi:glutaconyl-CoA/methylmalonyl-CoA decarboxylase subunit gamma